MSGPSPMPNTLRSCSASSSKPFAGLSRTTTSTRLSEPSASSSAFSRSAALTTLPGRSGPDGSCRDQSSSLTVSCASAGAGRPSPRQNRPPRRSASPQFRSSSVSSCSPVLRDAFDRVVVYCCKAVQQNYEGIGALVQPDVGRSDAREQRQRPATVRERAGRRGTRRRLPLRRLARLYPRRQHRAGDAGAGAGGGRRARLPGQRSRARAPRPSQPARGAGDLRRRYAVPGADDRGPVARADRARQRAGAHQRRPDRRGRRQRQPAAPALPGGGDHLPVRLAAGKPRRADPPQRPDADPDQPGGDRARQRPLRRPGRRAAGLRGPARDRRRALRPWSTWRSRARACSRASGPSPPSPPRAASPRRSSRAGHSDYAGGQEAARRLLAGGRPPEAVFCVNDLMAFGALDHLRGAGLRVPDDVSVIGFDDVPMAGWASYRLTTLRQDPARIAREVVAILDRRNAEPDLPPMSVCFPGRPRRSRDASAGTSPVRTPLILTTRAKRGTRAPCPSVSLPARPGGSMSAATAATASATRRTRCPPSRRPRPAGATTVEIDVVLTADGEPIVLHDLTVDRTTDGSGFAADLGLDHIRSLDAGAGFHPALRRNPRPDARGSARLGEARGHGHRARDQGGRAAGPRRRPRGGAARSDGRDRPGHRHQLRPCRAEARASSAIRACGPRPSPTPATPTSSACCGHAARAPSRSSSTCSTPDDGRALHDAGLLQPGPPAATRGARGILARRARHHPAPRGMDRRGPDRHDLRRRRALHRQARRARRPGRRRPRP